MRAYHKPFAILVVVLIIFANWREQTNRVLKLTVREKMHDRTRINGHEEVCILSLPYDWNKGNPDFMLYRRDYPVLLINHV